jgi:hypothetical protein
MRTQRGSGALAAALLAACGGYGAPDEVVYGEAVYSQGRPNSEFRPLGTYFLDPTVKIVEDTQITPDPTPMPAEIKNAIDTNMAALGWTPADLATADAAINVSLLRGTGQVYYPGYWCDYYSYGGCYYSWYYAGSYRFGSVITEMIDLSVAEPAQAQVLWTSQVYGVATTPQYDLVRVVSGLNRAFAQSPYLDTH